MIVSGRPSALHERRGGDRRAGSRCDPRAARRVAAPLTVLVVGGGMTGSGALVYMVAVDPVDVAVVRVVGVVAVREGDVAATLAVGVRVPFVRAVVGGGGHGGLLACLSGPRTCPGRRIATSPPALGDRVLDACCGAGGLVDAVDLSGALVALRERRARQEGLANLRFHQHDVTAWAARGGTATTWTSRPGRGPRRHRHASCGRTTPCPSASTPHRRGRQLRPARGLHPPPAERRRRTTARRTARGTARALTQRTDGIESALALAHGNRSVYGRETDQFLHELRDP